jgi:alkanesulfonate monooxygenase SsuD/methylene tetrahydromethanopterin reductase-like flavin-dependent oxidoreductase (luciferase family)
VRAVQELWLAGQRDAAAARVPAEIGRATNLLGTPAMVAGRLRLYRDAGITTLQAKLAGDHAARLDTLAQLIELVREVSSESDADAR